MSATRGTVAPQMACDTRWKKVLITSLDVMVVWSNENSPSTWAGVTCEMCIRDRLLAARQLGQLLAQKPFHAARLGGGMHAAHGFGGVHPQVLGRKRDLVTHRPHEELAARVLHHHAEALGALPRCEPAHVGAAHLHDADVYKRQAAWWR